VTLDSELTMQSHATLTLVNAFVTYYVHYCNSVFVGSTVAVTKRLQSMLNAAARLITFKKRSNIITPVLMDELHWLSVRQRVSYKITLMVYRCFHGSAPACLSRSCIPVASLAGRPPKFSIA